MRSFGLVDSKLEEAEFFLQKLKKCGWNLFEARCYFNAFVSSTRSVTFALQASLKGTEGSDEWYAAWQGRLRRSRVARFFHNCRTDIQHIGKNYLNGGVSGGDGPRLLVSDGSFGQDDLIPETDAFVASDMYFAIVCAVVRDAYDVFGYVIDPDLFYSLEGIKANGLTIADIEEELGLPRGYVSQSVPSEFTDRDIMHVLRRSAAISNCRAILDRIAPPPESAWS